MKYVLSLIFGLVLGVVTAAALILFNPLTLGQSKPPAGSDRVFGYSMAAKDSWLSTHGDRLEIPIVPAGAPLLFEEGIRGSWIASMPLSAKAGSLPAAGTRISVPSARSEFLKAGLLVDDYWLISVPESGTLLMRAENNFWPLLRDTVVWVDLLKQSFKGSGRYEPTIGPANAGAEVIGMTGEFTDFRGVGHDRLALDHYAGSLGAVTGQLMIRAAAPD